VHNFLYYPQATAHGRFSDHVCQW